MSVRTVDVIYGMESSVGRALALPAGVAIFRRV
jgi:hypothetical protein